jgi:AraC family transcriptional regulator
MGKEIAGAGEGRISVIRNDELVPLLPDRPAGGSLSSPLHGVIVERHAIGAIEIPEHEHASFCMHMQISGPVEMEWWSEGKNKKERPGTGSLILLAPGTRDRLRWTAPSRRVVVSIDESLLLRAARELGRERVPSFDNRWEFQDRQLRLLISELAREMESGWTTGSLYGDLLGMSLSVALVRKHATEGIAAPAVRGGMPKARLKRVLDYIAENCHLDLRLDDLAQVAGTSLFHFARLFRAETGATPHQYLVRQRLEQAKTLLRLRSRTIAEIAAETGFANASHFSRVFREHTGATPTEWKNR